MSITISAGQQSAISGKVRHQRYLVEIELDAQTLRLASGGTYTVGGNTFVKSGVMVDQVKTGKGAGKTARIAIPNEDNVYTLLALTDTGFNYKPVKVWEFYGNTSPAEDDLNLIFTGEVYAVPSIDRNIILDCATTKMKTKMVPDLTLGPPDVNHLPYTGQRVVVGNEVYTVEIR